MDRRSSLNVLGFAGGALVLGLLSSVTAACSAPADEGATRGTTSSVTQRPFDRNAVIDDKSMRDPEALTVADVQKFLDKTPWGTKSALAKYTEGGKSAAQIMVDTAKAHGINPIEMLVRVQMEQGLISKTTATSSAISIAFGCGCPHSAVCNDSYRGFANQAECAAGTMRRSMDKAVTSAGTVSGWSRGKSKATEDGITVLPKNAATAALYTYTPWVGEAGGGKKGVGGASLHAQVWDRFAESVSYGAWATTTASTTEEAPTTEPSANADAGADAADPTTEPEPDPTPDPDPTPEADAGTTTPSPDAGTGDGNGEGENADAGKTGESTTSTNGPPDDGSEDDAIIGEGSSPPSSNGPPPRLNTPSKPEELPEATDSELAGKSKAQAGCSTSGGGGQSGSNGLVIASAAALAMIVSRRRRSAA